MTISIALEKEVYYAGETIIGKVELTQKESVKINNNVTIRIHGYAEVFGCVFSNKSSHLKQTTSFHLNYNSLIVAWVRLVLEQTTSTRVRFWWCAHGRKLSTRATSPYRSISIFPPLYRRLLIIPIARSSTFSI